MNIQRLLTEQTILEPETTREHIAYCFTKHNMKKKMIFFIGTIWRVKKKKSIFAERNIKDNTHYIYDIQYDMCFPEIA